MKARNYNLASFAKLTSYIACSNHWVVMYYIRNTKLVYKTSRLINYHFVLWGYLLFGKEPDTKHAL